jgi:hypothetical protein
MRVFEFPGPRRCDLTRSRLLAGWATQNLRKRGRFRQERIVGALLVVSGPTASGKSTFLRHLQDNTLPVHVRQQLPPDASQWSQTSANRISRRVPQTLDGRQLKPGADAELIFHYDFLRAYSFHFSEYTADPSLRLLGEARRLIVIVLRPERRHLMKQLAERELDPTIRRERTSPGNRPVRRLVKEIRSKFARLGFIPSRRFGPYQDVAFPPGRMHDRAYFEELLACYDRDGWLDGWYARWMDYLRRHHPAARVVEVTMPRLTG